MEITGRTGLNNDQKCIPACGEFRVLKLVGWGMDKSFTGARPWRILVKTTYDRSVMIGRQCCREHQGQDLPGRQKRELDL